MPENIKSDEKEVTPHDKKKDMEVAETEELHESEQDNVAGGRFVAC